jgi:molybdopterin/thiamine biosynthesis adenylyltransferase/rhodanese-related sulfurtransferase
MELNRYLRHLALPNFGAEQQQMLADANVLVVGAGGLGAPVLLYLAAAGVGTLGIADPDRVSLTNLQRQVLFKEKDLGALKATVAKRELEALNSSINLREHPTLVTRENAPSLLEEYDIVVDATDNFPARYLLNDACVLYDKVYIYGSVFRYEGQVSVFNYPRPDGTRGPNYRDLFPTPPPPDQVPDCAEGGVLGVLPGIIGSVQASEVIKCICGLGEVLDGRVWLFDAEYLETRTLKISAQDADPITELIDYEAFCGLTPVDASRAISPTTLHQWRQSSFPHRLIDVRRAEELAGGKIESEHIPLDQIPSHTKALVDSPVPVVFYCQSGRRTTTLLQQFPAGHFYHLEGGLNAWKAAGYES